jgi:Phosphopantetheine attachment site
MSTKALSSLDFVEAVMAMEEIFGTDIPDYDAERLRSPREIIDWLEPYLVNQRPNKLAIALLRKLAKAQNHPELDKDSDNTWRREQIAAVVR